MKKESTAIRLNLLMNERNLRQVDILKKCKPFCEKYNVKLERNDLSQYVNGKVEPRQEKLTILGLALNVSEAWLMGFDVPMERTSNNLNAKDQKDISSILAKTEELLKQDGLMFDGEPASPESIDSIISAMKIGMEMAKQKNKEKYTPKKHKKD